MNPRWIAKRSLKWGVELAVNHSGAGFIYNKTACFLNGYRVLTYHKVAPHPRSSYDISEGHFMSHIKYLSDHHAVLGLDDLVKGVVEGPLPPRGAVAITFDDGFEEAVGFVGETLKKSGLTATFFVVTGILDDPEKKRGHDFLNWDQVRLLRSSGFGIGSHTVSHRSLGTLDDTEVNYELKQSYERIVEETGASPVGFSYPYGTLRDFSPEIAELVRQAGYNWAVTAVHGLNHPGCNPFTIRRTTMTAGDGLKTFRMIMKGCLDAWYFVDRFGYYFQRPNFRGFRQSG
jgi:peptidoglycan/xylan/chitin deacetylase (PgdA/CDA1 family)